MSDDGAFLYTLEADRIEGFAVTLPAADASTPPARPERSCWPDPGPPWPSWPCPGEAVPGWPGEPAPVRRPRPAPRRGSGPACRAEPAPGGGAPSRRRVPTRSLDGRRPPGGRGQVAARGAPGRSGDPCPGPRRPPLVRTQRRSPTRRPDALTGPEGALTPPGAAVSPEQGDIEFSGGAAAAPEARSRLRGRGSPAGRADGLPTPRRRRTGSGARRIPSGRPARVTPTRHGRARWLPAPPQPDRRRSWGR